MCLCGGVCDGCSPALLMAVQPHVLSLSARCLLGWNIRRFEALHLLRALRLPVQVQLLGQSISVGRPSGYVDPSRAQEAAQAAAAALQAFQAGDMQTMEAQLEQANLGVTASPAAAGPSPAAAGEAARSPHQQTQASCIPSV